MRKLAKAVIGFGIGLAVLLSSGCSECVGVRDDECDNKNTKSKPYVLREIIESFSLVPPKDYTPKESNEGYKSSKEYAPDTLVGYSE